MLTVTDLRKRYRSTQHAAVDGVSFEVKEGELFTLLGPSGCGKTTTLRCVAGLEHPDAGAIHVRDTPLYDSERRIDVPANERGLGIVFQSYAIWPHMTVFRNVSFPLEVSAQHRKVGKAEIRERVHRVLAVVELEEYSDRPATKLSGGQQQRLALARALVGGPDLLLLDEPLSNLDAKLRESMRFELKRLQREVGATAVYVTHDQAEALTLSNRIAIMNEGRIVQVGSPREIYTRPNCRFAAEFVGVSNFIDGVVGERSSQTTVVETREGPLRVGDGRGLPMGSDVLVSVRPEDVEISIDPPPQPPANVWQGKVLTRAFAGDSVDHVVRLGEQQVRVRCNPSVSIEPGTGVHLSLPEDKIVLVP
jgi:iron(III) transport system ATP-binding protein